MTIKKKKSSPKKIWKPPRPKYFEFLTFDWFLCFKIHKSIFLNYCVSLGSMVFKKFNRERVQIFEKKKSIFFSIYCTKSCFIRIVQKVNFWNWNSILCHFFSKNTIVPLGFFHIFIKIHKPWILIKKLKKTKGTTLFFVKKMAYNWISTGKIDFLTILIKHDVIG